MQRKPFLPRSITMTSGAAGFAAWLCLSAAGATAAPIDFEPVVGTISGTDSFVVPFNITEQETYRALLVDLESPAPFQFLGLAILDEDDPGGVPFGFLEEPGVVDFTVEPGRYLALVGGIADADVNIGTFGLEISNVPLPPAAWLLISSLVSMSFVTRRRKLNRAALA